MAHAPGHGTFSGALTMLCRIPYTYTAVATLKGHRNPEPLLFGAWTEADIPDLSGLDAPEALAWRETLFGGVAVRKATRWHDGANWSLPVDYGNADAAISAEEFAGLARLEDLALRNRTGRGPSDVVGRATRQDVNDLSRFLNPRGPVKEIDPAGIREMHHDGRREAEDRAILGARNLLFVDGKLWIRGGEPCYALSVPGLNGPEHQEPAVGVSQQPHPQWSSYAMSFFRADRLEDACDYLLEITGANGVRIAGEIEILIADAVLFDDEKEALLRCARETVANRTEWLPHASEEAIMAWVALRDGLKQDEPDAEVMADRLAEARRTLAVNGQPAATIDKALRRWELRPIPGESFHP